MIESDSKKFIPTRELLDSGSQSNLIIEEMAQTLRIGRRRFSRQLWGFGNEAQKILTAVTVMVKSLDEKFSRKLAESERGNYAAVCRSDFHLDDYLGGDMSKADAFRSRDALMTIMNSAGFELR